MTQVPDLALNSGQTIRRSASVSSKSTRQRPPRPSAGRWRWAIGISTPPRCTGTRRASARVRASGLDRSEVYITSKLEQWLPRAGRGPPGVRRHARGPRLGLRRPVLDPLAAADALRRRLRLHLADVGGVLPRRPGQVDRRLQLPGSHLRRLAEEAEVVPAVNQVEVHPYFTNEEVRAYGSEHGILTEAWSPIAQGAVLKDPTITAIAERVGRPRLRSPCAGTSSAATSSSKSTTPSRISENFALFDFEPDRGRHDGDQCAGPGRGRAYRRPPRQVGLRTGSIVRSRSVR